MLILNGPPINTNCSDDLNETLVERKAKTDKNYDDLMNYNSIPIGYTVAVQREVGGPWTHGTVVENGDLNCSD